MRTVEVTPPSFPEVAPNELLPSATPGEVWRVVCGDLEHWRCGYYSPAFSRPDQLKELEQHTCPELFLLVSGKVSLLLGDASPPRVVALEAGRPILVTAPHGGFCPDGPHTGVCLVVERDRFQTAYSSIG